MNYSLFAPAVALMNRLRYPVKFSLIGLLALIAIAVQLGAQALKLTGQAGLARNELVATELLRPLAKVVQLTQQHRDLSVSVLRGNAAMKDALSANQTELDAAVAAVSKVETKLDPVLHAEAAWQKLKKRWEALRSDGMSLSTVENTTAHSALIGQLLREQVQVADAGGLTVDPDIDANYLGAAAVTQLPEVLEQLGRLRSLGELVLTKKELGGPQQADFAVHVHVLNQALDRLRQDLDKAASANHALAAGLDTFSKELAATSGGVLDMVNNDILTSGFSIPPKDYFDKATAAIDVGYSKLFDTLLPTLDTRIKARIAGLQRQLLWQSALALAMFALLAYLALGIYFSVMTSVRQLSSGSAALAGGDLTSRIALDSRDELSQVAVSFNHMAESFSKLLHKVQQTAANVATAANETARSSIKVSESSHVQSEAAGSMAAAVEQMTVGVGQISELAGSAQQISMQNGGLSSEGGEIVAKTVREMEQIAQMVNDSAKIIAELGLHSDNISAVVGVIKEIADQTNLLALNAAIEAARAGEQGRGFAVVADEVRKLAERTSQSTQEIGAMIQSIQSGTGNAVASMKASVTRVADGVALSRQAGEAIGKVKDGAGQVSQAVTDISQALREQSVANNEISRNVERIAQMAEENNAAVLTTSAAAQQLERLSAELATEVRRFRVD
ncbi:MAG TPA: methyl-accepting chemotaxis protein [Rhodocyclaceae bacterium]|nr:methyl-accepting chemotaxis protein [Rhodocyclaceae bacterium]